MAIINNFGCSGHTLKGGAALWLNPLPSSKLVSVCLSFPGSALVEQPGQYGLSALLAEILCSGGGCVPENEWHACFDRIGNGLHAFAGNDTFGLKFSCWPHALSSALEQLGKVLRRENVEAALFTREREAQRSQLREEKDNFAAYGLRLVRQQYFGQNPFSFAPLGVDEDLAAATSPDMERFVSVVLGSERMVLAVSGSFVESEVVAAVERMATGMRSGGAFSHLPVVRSARGSGQIHKEVAKEQALYCKLFPTIGYLDDERTKMNVLLHCWNGLSGPLFEELREQRGLAYYAYATWLATARDGCLAFVCGCEPARLQEVRDCIESEWQKLLHNGPNLQIFDSARRQLISGLRLARQRTNWRAAYMAQAATRGLCVHLGEPLEKVVESMDPQSLQSLSATIHAAHPILEFTMGRSS